MKQTSPTDPVPSNNRFQMEAAASIDSKNEALAYKKCKLYGDSLQEQPLRDMAHNFAQHHKQHFDALQNYLNTHQ